MPTNIERRKAIIMLVITALLWSTSGVFVKALSWGPVAILSGRALFTSIVFLLYMRRFPVKWSGWMILAASMSVITQFLFVTSTKLTTAANSIFLQYTAPIYVLLLGYWLLHEKPSKADWISMGLILIGLVLFFGDQLSPEGFYGNILAVISGITSALMIVAFRAQKDAHPEDSILLASLIMAIGGLPFILKESWSATNWLVIAYLGIFQIGVAFILFTKGIKHLPAIEANLLGTLEPIFNPVWVYLFLGEAIGKSALLGGVVVLTGVIVNAVGSARAKPEESINIAP